jgi:hypothetical protein
MRIFTSDGETVMGKKIRSVKGELKAVIDGNLYIVTREDINPPELGGCWEFPPWSLSGGYATFSLYGKSYRVSREVWRLETHSAIPAGMLICHHCDNPPCFRYKHLYLGTYATNSADCIARGRSPHMRFTALSKENITEIRQKIISGMPPEITAKKYKISVARVMRIAQGKEQPTRHGRTKKKPED